MRAAEGRAPQGSPLTDSPTTAKSDSKGTPTFDAAEARLFVDVVYGDVPGWFGLSWVDRDGEFRSQAFSAAERALDWAAKLDIATPEGIYLRTTTMRAKPKKRGEADESAYLPGLWADLDFGTVGHKHQPDKHDGLVLPPDADQAYAIIKASGLPKPTLLVNSGGGLYPWWLLDEAADLTDTRTEWIQRSAEWQRQLAAGAATLGYFYGSGVGDLARVLRLPGSVNRKTPEERPCRVVHWDGPRYSVATLSDALEASQMVVAAKPGPRPARRAKLSPEEKAELDVQAALDPGPFDILEREVGIRGVLLAADWTDCDCGGRGDTVACFTRPGGGSTTNHSAHILEAEPHVLVVFSEEAGLPTGGGQHLTVGQLFAHLHHDGDLSAAAFDVKAAMRGEGGEAARALIPFGLPVTIPEEVHHGQLRMALRLAVRERNRLRYVHKVGWHVWDGTRWKPDSSGAAKRAVQATLDAALAELPGMSKDDQKALFADVRTGQSNSGAEGILGWASSLEPLATSPDQLDADPLLFNTKNGTLDLHTGKLRDANPADLITKVAGCSYDPSAKSDTFTKFIEKVLPPDVRAYVARLFGLALEGRVSEHIGPVFTGVGANGKSTLVEAVMAVFGDYALAAEPDLLVERGPTHTTGTADLLGVRLAVCSETGDGKRLDAATYKKLTGGDTLTARHMRQDNFQFKPSHTLVLVTNHKPRASADDQAVWRRMRVVPFGVVIPKAEIDPTLGHQLATERAQEAILAWIVQGYREWAEFGLAEPGAVEAATASYREDNDPLGRFLTERCTESEQATVQARPLFIAWEIWCDDNNESPGSEVAFAKRMRGRGYEKGPVEGRATYKGIALLDKGSTDDG